MSRYVVKSNMRSKQKTDLEDSWYEDMRIVEPFLDYGRIRALYAANIYHQRSLKLKALLLSQVDTTELDKYLPKGVTANKFLYKFMLNAETYGSAFLEKSVPVSGHYLIYNLNTYTARVGRDGDIYQIQGTEYVPMDGAHFMYDTILSEFYGEPDYVASINQIVTLYKADAYNAKFFDNGAKPDHAIIFEDSDPSQDQIDAITEFYRKEFRGYKNAHKTLILTTGEGTGETKPKIRIEKVGGVEDLSFEKLKKVGRDEIIAAHGVPPRMVGVIDPNALGGGGELVSQLHMFNEVTIKPKMALVESFFEQMGITLKLKPFDATNFKDDADVVTSLVGAGILTPAEAKRVMGWKSSGD